MSNPLLDSDFRPQGALGISELVAGVREVRQDFGELSIAGIDFSGANFSQAPPARRGLAIPRRHAAIPLRRSASRS